MNQETLWREFSTLSPQAQTLVLEFIAIAKQCSNAGQPDEQDEFQTLENLIANKARIEDDERSPSDLTPSDKLSLDHVTYDPNAIPIWELVAQISATVPDEEWAKLPTDLARNFDHYQ
ncbi:MAG: hypothetical protein F6K30_11030 [Cyanothece sp. SIO2G6]|nr:hypothetical protein [Cyanothece sp. SIO2G6]